MSDQRPPELRCVDCGARWAQLDDDGMCQACFVARGLRAMAEMLKDEREQADMSRRHTTSGLDAIE